MPYNYCTSSEENRTRFIDYLVDCRQPFKCIKRDELYYFTVECDFNMFLKCKDFTENLPDDIWFF